MNLYDFDFNLLKTFVCVYESGGIDRASKKLFISQPAVSIAIKRLEQQIDAQLFVRTTKSLKPTKEGISFYEQSKLILNQINNLVASISNDENTFSGTLKIGASESIINTILMPKISKFCKKYNKVHIIFTETLSTKLLDYMNRGDIDICFLEQPKALGCQYISSNFKPIEYCFVASKQNKLASLKQEDFQSNNIAVVKDEIDRDYFEHFCLDNNINIVPEYNSANYKTIMELCKQNLCIAFMPKQYISNDDKLEIKVLSTNMILPKSKIMMIVNKNNYSKLIDTFLEFL